MSGPATTPEPAPASHPVRPPDPLIVGLIGRAGNGKDTAGAHLVDRWGFVRYAFAAPLRQMLEALAADCNISPAWLRDRALKEQPITGLGVSYRQMSQELGTGWGRGMHPDFWLRVAERVLGLPGAPVHDRIVITDVRFVNEADWIRRHGGTLWRITRPQAAEVRSHISEQYAAAMFAEAEIDNRYSEAHLHGRLDELVQTLLAWYGVAR